MYTTRKERQEFYQSEDWKNMRTYKLSLMPFCERCLNTEKRYVTATEVHHKEEIHKRPDLALDYNNLESLCKSCHSRHTLKENNFNRKIKGTIKRLYHIK